MGEWILYYAHYAALLLFGLLLSFAFSGIRLWKRKNILIILALFMGCGLLQLLLNAWFDEGLVWRLYPLITHLPILAVLWLFYRRRLVAALAAVSSAYLFCQPAKWIGLLLSSLGLSPAAEQAARIAALLAVGAVSLRYIAAYLSKLFNKDLLSGCIFGGLPIFYYLFDYLTGIYTDLWSRHGRITAEFLPFFLCIVFVLFCVVYYKEYEMKADAERKEHLIRLFARQQNARIEAVERSEKEIRILRHDLRLLLNNLAVCIDNGEPEAAREMIASYNARIESTKLERFCENELLNCVLSDYSAKCKKREIPFFCEVKIASPKVDEMLFCSILSNALDNAFNAQAALPGERQGIKVLIREAEGKLLLSVKNEVLEQPVFVDGLPITDRKDHGYGTQSIRYITGQLGGNCQFSARDGWFILRVIL